MIRALFPALFSLALTGCASTSMRSPGLTAEADRSEQRAIAAQKAGAREVAQIQDERADRLRTQAANYTVADGFIDTLLNLFLDNPAQSPKRR